MRIKNPNATYKEYMAKKMFSDPIAPQREEKSVKNPWTFTAPCYDDRNNIQAGTNYGKGFRNPIGHKGSAKMNVPTLPKSNVKTEEVVTRDFDNLDMYD